MTNSAFSNFTLAGSYASALQVANDNDKPRHAKHLEAKNSENEPKYRPSLVLRIAKLLSGRSGVSSTSPIRTS
jgi:hypothetical protein